MLHVICTYLRPGHLSIRVGDGLRHSEEIVKKKKNPIVPLNAIIIIIVITIIIIIIILEMDALPSGHRGSLHLP